MPLRVKCPHCQAACAVSEQAAGRKVRCPRCQQAFQPEPPPAADAVTDASPPAAPPPRRRGDDLIPPQRKSKGSLIPPPPGGPSIKKTPSFAEREVRGLAVYLIIAAVGGVIMLGVIGAIAAWSLSRAVRPEQAPPAQAPAPSSSGPAPAGGGPAARDHGPPPAFEEWKVLAEHRLEQQGGVWHGAVSPDGKLLATASNAFLRLWDLTADPPTEKTSMRMPAGRSSALHFAPDSKTLFLGCIKDNSLRVLDVTGPQISERYKMHDWARCVWVVAHSPDGGTLAVGADDMTVWLYDVTGGLPKEKKVLRVENTTFGVKQLFFTRDGRRLILGTGAGAVRLWDVAGPEPKELAAHDGNSDTFLLPMALDGSTLAVARGKTVHLLDVSDTGFTEWMQLDKHPKALRAVSFSPDGRLLATTGTDGQIMLWKPGLDRPVLTKQRANTFGEVLFVPGSPDVRVVACMWSAPGTIYLFKVGK
jgi:predicted Zn finger-like uncharacterized protein